ncbi:MAG TPA: redox-regulated ATPase YchF [Gammaproteobacteria bacterium]|nr:redox-regulated ATPase YchF [Gammaproteobacteria bacterium]
MALQCGVVGLPNVGKSTLFNALTQAGIGASNYPFCTIEPNVGRVSVPDLRLDSLTEIVKPQKTIPNTIEFVDIAGLVEGASKGEGLGNQFLANIREVDAILHVVRCFDDDNITHVHDHVDPIRDIEIIETELAIADLQMAEKAQQRLAKKARSGDKDAQEKLDAINLVCKKLDNNDPILPVDPILSEYRFLTAKPCLFVANTPEEGDNDHLSKLKEYLIQRNQPLITISANIEAEIQSLGPDDQALFLEEIGQKEPGLNRLIRSSYQLLNLITFFTAGEKEVRAWTLQQDINAQNAAGVIHTDFIKGFIRAEVISYQDFIDKKGEQGAKEAGLWRLEGKDYIVKDGDVIHFRTNA